VLILGTISARSGAPQNSEYGRNLIQKMGGGPSLTYVRTPIGYTFLLFQLHKGPDCVRSLYEPWLRALISATICTHKAHGLDPHIHHQHMMYFTISPLIIVRRISEDPYIKCHLHRHPSHGLLMEGQLSLWVFSIVTRPLSGNLLWPPTQMGLNVNYPHWHHYYKTFLQNLLKTFFFIS
jgi:hypothetical protein